jgi:hypothetical protein
LNDPIPHRPDVEWYLKQAAEADAMVAKVHDPDARRSWEMIANSFRTLARQLEANQRTQGQR